MDQNDKFEAAEFRVRLFLSVDLSGSNAFKNSADGEDRDSGSPIWVTIFEQFYRDFPDKFKTEYSTGKKTKNVRMNVQTYGRQLEMSSYSVA